MKSLDKNLAAAVKAVAKRHPNSPPTSTASLEFRDVRHQVSGTELSSTVDRLISMLSTPGPDSSGAEAAGLVRALLSIGYTATAAEYFNFSVGRLQEMNLWEVLPLIPNAACFDKWLKIAKKPVREILNELLSQPRRAYDTAAADWLCSRADAKSLAPVLDLIISRQPRPKHLPSWHEVIVTGLKKDKKGMLLRALIATAADVSTGTKTLVEVITSNRQLFKSMPEALTLILTHKQACQPAVNFVTLLLDPTLIPDCDQRETTSAILARLGTGILLAERRSQEADVVLEFIRKTSRQLRSITKGETSQSRTWVLENLHVEERQPDGRLCVNLQGARHIALAFEKVDQGFPPKEILSVTARHLGLLTIGRRDEVVAYDPLLHDDTEDGLVPGDTVVILEPGLAYNNEAVLRAKVKKNKGDSNV